MSSTPVATPIVVRSTPNPSLSPSPDKVVDSQSERKETLAKVNSAIERARADFPGKTAVYFIDIESDSRLDHSGNKQFESASLMKLIVIAELYRRIQIGEVEPEHSLILERKHIVGGSGELQNQEPGTSYPVKVLAEKMITQSDNTATQMLTEFLTKESLNKSLKDLGLTGSSVNRDVYDFEAIERGEDNYITAKDAAVLMEQLARDELPGSEEIHSILELQERNDMIGHKYPKDVRVAHKTGELNGILHDVGIVYAPRGAFVLALLSEDVSDQAKAIEVWSSLSTQILSIYQLGTPSPSPSPREASK